MNEDYVSYELAVKLKACGFDEPCEYYYTSKGRRVFNKNKPPYANNRFLDEIGNEICSAVSLWHAQKWLREKLLLNVGVDPAIPTLKWQFYIDDLNQHINPYDGELMTRWDDDMQEKADKQMYDSYECALSAGITAVLELIKEGE